MIVCATIVSDMKVLLVRHSSRSKPDYGHWLLPAGRMKLGESPEEALKREMKEELSLEVDVVRELTEVIDPYTKDGLINFLCTQRTSNIVTSSELEEAKWFNTNEIRGIVNINRDLKQFLLLVLDSEGRVKDSRRVV